MAMQTATRASARQLPVIETWMNYAGDIKGRARAAALDARRRHRFRHRRA